MKPVAVTRRQPFTQSHLRLVDYVAMTKPRISLMVLFTVVAGFLMANPQMVDFLCLIHTLIGTGLVAAGASVMNQLLERRTDALMQRTEKRPIPSGRLQPIEVLIYGLVLGFSGLIYLFLLVPQPLCWLLAAATFGIYVWIYTPLKKLSSLNTLVGAIPGALPPIIGWTAAKGTLSWEAFLLFLILFFWQIPHFLAIAWIYREDYLRAGLRMLPVLDKTGYQTGRQMIFYCLCLLPISLVPLFYGINSLIYIIGSLMVGISFLATTIIFYRSPGMDHAKLVLRGSLLHLPILLALLLLGYTGLIF